MVLQKAKRMKKKTEKETKQIYYISDLHLGDQRVFNLCERDFSIDDFNKKIIKNWNNVVKENDDVYLLGDILFEQYYEGINILKKLNGNKHLIVGNHDLPMLEEFISANIFKSINYQILIKDNDETVFLCHYPIMNLPEDMSGSYHIYGHIHNKEIREIKEYYKNKKAYNASCDVIDFTPQTLNGLIKLKEENNEAYIN